MITNVRNSLSVDPTSYRPPPPSSRPPESQGASLETRVSLSPEARAPQSEPPASSVATLATGYDFEHADLNIRYDVSDLDSGIVRYAGTGEIVTPENQARYEAQARAVADAGARLYDTEKSRGSADTIIVDELLRLVGSQPSDFLDVIKWNAPVNAP